jgi:hypothetical protein
VVGVVQAEAQCKFLIASSESAAVYMEAAEEWKSKVQNVLSELLPENQLNTDETGVFYRRIPRKRLVQKGDKCKGGKLCTERYSVPFAVVLLVKNRNAVRRSVITEKHVDTKHLPVEWCSKRKAWVTTVAEEWLTDMNHMKMKDSRKSCCLLTPVIVEQR